MASTLISVVSAKVTKKCRVSGLSLVVVFVILQPLAFRKKTSMPLSFFGKPCIENLLSVCLCLEYHLSNFCCERFFVIVPKASG